MLDKAGGDPRHKYTSDDKSHIEAIARSADEKSSSHIVARLSSPLSSPLKEMDLQKEASFPPSRNDSATVKKQLSSLPHKEANNVQEEGSPLDQMQAR
eukprot:7584373-Alexandrium_andersonii.AAC.1